MNRKQAFRIGNRFISLVFLALSPFREVGIVGCCLTMSAGPVRKAVVTEEMAKRWTTNQEIAGYMYTTTLKVGRVGSNDSTATPASTINNIFGG